MTGSAAPIHLRVVSAVLVLLALVLATERADGRQALGCAKLNEHRGCKLPVGSGFSGDKQRGSDRTTLTQRKSKSWTLAITMHRIACTRGDRKARVSLDKTMRKTGSRLEVGTRYSASDSSSRRDPDTGSTTTADFEVSFKVMTAKTVQVSVKYQDRLDGKLHCGGGYKAKLKRVS
jgi:hypothetical protein